MAEKRQVACPRCGRKQPYQSPDSIYWCTSCRGQFDDDPTEGGDYSADPSRRAERAEEERIRRQDRTRARMGKR